MDIKYMKLALKEANKAYEKEEVPIGAVIVKDDKVIARAHNLRETKKQSCAHAEILAIQKACQKLNAWRLDGCDMYVTLEPCPMCAGAILNARIKNLYIGAIEPRSGAIISKIRLFDDYVYNHKTNYEIGLLQSECKATMQNFFKNIRERHKSVDNNEHD